MKRLAIMTVGKTHSGKTTFAKALEKELSNVPEVIRIIADISMRLD